jgi:hypothetical protein
MDRYVFLTLIHGSISIPTFWVAIQPMERNEIINVLVRYQHITTWNPGDHSKLYLLYHRATHVRDWILFDSIIQNPLLHVDLPDDLPLHISLEVSLIAAHVAHVVHHSMGPLGVHLGEVANQCEVCLTYPAFVMAIQTLLNRGDIFHTLGELYIAWTGGYRLS